MPEVIKEIKNKRQLKRLCVLPYDLVVDEPSPAAVAHVIEFAKKTGDYLSLSSADLKVIALTYQLECELVGKGHLRSEPVVAKTIASKQKPAELLDKAPLPGFYVPPEKQKVDENVRLNDPLVAEKKAEESAEDGSDAESEESEESDTEPDTEQSADQEETIEELEAKFTALNCGLMSESEANEILVSVSDRKPEGDEGDDEESEEGSDDDDDEDDEDDDSDWITPGNVVEMKSACGKDVAEEKQVRVACMSTDFAVQNVLKQINCNLAALDGRIIKQMRTYILRCYACFKTTSIMTKVFCPTCGHKTLKRVAVSMDEAGQQVIHINLRRPLTAKGKNQSIPTPRGGKHSSNPIVCEDQPIPKQFPSRVARTKTNAMEEDYIAGELRSKGLIQRELLSISCFALAISSGFKAANSNLITCFDPCLRQAFLPSCFVTLTRNRPYSELSTAVTSNNGRAIMHTEI